MIRFPRKGSRVEGVEMKKRYIIISVLFVFMSAVGCNSSNNSEEEAFSQFTTETFAVSADEEPVDIESRGLRLDIENNESVFDQLIIDSEFSV